MRELYKQAQNWEASNMDQRKRISIVDSSGGLEENLSHAVRHPNANMLNPKC